MSIRRRFPVRPIIAPAKGPAEFSPIANPGSIRYQYPACSISSRLSSLIQIPEFSERPRIVPLFPLSPLRTSPFLPFPNAVESNSGFPCHNDRRFGPDDGTWRNWKAGSLLESPFPSELRGLDKQSFWSNSRSGRWRWITAMTQEARVVEWFRASTLSKKLHPLRKP